MTSKLDVSLVRKIAEGLFAYHTFVLLFALFVTIHFLRKAQRKKLNEPPLVKYKYPIIGHTWECISDEEAFMAKCRAEYGNIFRIYVYGRVMTVVGKDHAHEVFTSESCSFRKGSDAMIPIHSIMGSGKNFEGIGVELIRKTLMGNVGVYCDLFQSTLHEKIEAFGDLKSKQIDSPLEFVQEIVARAMAHVILGEEAERIPELMGILFDTARIISGAWLVPKTLSYIHPYLHRLRILWTIRLGGDVPRKNLSKVTQLVKPLIDERIMKEKKLGSAWKEPIDLLSGLINNKKIDKSNVDYEWIAVHIQLLVFASVHATSTVGARCIIEYAMNSKSWQELLDEQVKVNPENKKFITTEETNQMEKLDSFIKESIRMSDVVVGMHHSTIVPVFRFSNGYELPVNSLIGIDKSSIHLDPTHTSGNPLEFDGNRYVGKDSPSTKVTRAYVPFGIGKHACPGRYFAIFEIKMLMAHLIRNFTIKPVDEKKIERKHVAGFLIPYGQLIFERRMQ